MINTIDTSNGTFDIAMPNTKSIDDFSIKVVVAMRTRDEGINKLNIPTRFKIHHYKFVLQ